MKVYELMHLLGACPANAEVRVSKVLGRDEIPYLVKEAYNDDAAEVTGTIVDFDKRTAVTENDTVELYLS